MTTFAPGTFKPAPGRGSLPRMLLAHARTEAMLTLRNGEQILLTVIIPLALLVALSLMSVIPMPEPRVGSATARIFALAIISSAFTGQAIALGLRPALRGAEAAGGLGVAALAAGGRTGLRGTGRGGAADRVAGRHGVDPRVAFSAARDCRGWCC